MLGRESGPSPEPFSTSSVVSESVPLFFLPLSTHFITYDAREEIYSVPWDQSMSEELRGKKARETGRSAIKGRELVRGNSAQGVGGNRDISGFECRNSSDPSSELKHTC